MHVTTHHLVVNGHPLQRVHYGCGPLPCQSITLDGLSPLLVSVIVNIVVVIVEESILMVHYT
eukprot:5609304-Amphidinium_carterae.1